MKKAFWIVGLILNLATLSVEAATCENQGVNTNEAIIKALEGGVSVHSATIIKVESGLSVVRLQNFREIPDICVEIEQTCDDRKMAVKSSGSCDKYLKF